MFSCVFVLLALFSATQGRAVNISNAWVLPEEGFPVFYRYFRDAISWYEADAVCQFHHANLVTVDTTAQYDAVRAYLKELDISNAVWVGLIRSNPEGDFTWTDYRRLSGDGYWSTAPDARAAPPLCAAADPAADYRWEARPCGGPVVAPFICELPVPQWALGGQGCMVRSLPALTVLYLPESAAVQLTADCGLAGTRRVLCTGNIKREDLLKNISCTEDENTSNILPNGTSWSTTDASFTDQEIPNDITTEDTSNTELKGTNVAEKPTTQLPIENPKEPNNSSVKRQSLLDQLTQHYLTKDMNLNILHENNLESNDIPHNVKGDPLLTEEQSERLEDEKHIQYKMLHDALAKHGNFENIFSQSTDHFVPPLVMAKAKISNDMTVLSLAEKHAQQLAEERLARYNKHDDVITPIQSFKAKLTTTTPSTEVEIAPIISAIHTKKNTNYEKKDKIKPMLKKFSKKYENPKKYYNIDNKLKIDQQTSTTSDYVKDTTTKLPFTHLSSDLSTESDSSLDLTVMLKELGMENDTAPLFTNRTENVLVSTENVLFKETTITDAISTNKVNVVTSSSNTKSHLQPATSNYDIIKDTPTDTQNPTPTTAKISKINLMSTLKSVDSTSMPVYSTSDPTIIKINISVETESPITTNLSDPVTKNEASETTTLDSLMINNFTVIISDEGNKTQINNLKLSKTLDQNSSKVLVSDKVLRDNGEIVTETRYIDAKEGSALNFTVSHDENEKGSNDTVEKSIEDFQSPLLSAANEPLHKPSRSRRPQKPHMNKFNPFRILG